jgi:hypothetical protein
MTPALKAMPPFLTGRSPVLSTSELLQVDDASIEGHAAPPYRKESSPLYFIATVSRYASDEGHAALPHRKESSPLYFRATAGR